MTASVELNRLEQFFGWLLNSYWRTVIALLIAGAIYPLAFSPIDFWPLAFLSVIFVLMVLLKSSALDKPPLSSFKIGFYWGIGCFAVGASWVYVSIHEFGHASWWLASLLTLLFVIYLALFKAIFGYLCGKLIKFSGQSLLVLIAPFCWIISEYLQASVFNGFPWLLAGYSQIDGLLFGLLSWFGVYGVSWFVVTIAAVIALILLLGERRYWLILIILGGIVIVATFEHFLQNDAESKLVKAEQIDVALVQPNIPQEQKWDSAYFDSIIQILYSETQSLWSADLIIWPEGAIPAYEQQVSPIIEDLKQRAIKNDNHLVLGIADYDTDKELSFATMKVYGKESQSYQKQILVPFGEYVPLQNWFRGLINFFDLPMSDFSPALDKQQPFQFDNFSLIPAICYEIVYPDIIRQLTLHAKRSGSSNLPKVIATISNDAWFGDSFGPYQHMQMARTRALELGIPLVRSTNDGITAFVDQYGNIQKQMPRYTQGYIRQSVSLANRETLFRRYGFNGLYLILLLSGFFILLAGIKRQK